MVMLDMGALAIAIGLVAAQLVQFEKGKCMRCSRNNIGIGTKMVVLLLECADPHPTPPTAHSLIVVGNAMLQTGNAVVQVHQVRDEL